MIKLIVFDLWSTLATRTNPHYHFSIEIKNEFKLKLDENKIISIFEESVQTKFWENEYDAYKEFTKNIKIPLTKKNIFKIIEFRERAEKNIRLYDFTIKLLKKLKKKGYKIGLLTNSSRFIYDSIKQKTNLLEYIDYPLFSYQVGLVKPQELFYITIQEKANIKNPKEILMIGDNYEKDYKTPKSLGWNAIHFKNSYNNLKKELEKNNIKI
ncbi:MAG: HAD family hydrolase [Candidatus ainarchaeum sp.]|nr:HAD family hydrolase [Candidatus ainarchaeum sp.]MDD3975544.1 HAD family hydrolase [Candidatus ainarchaeum sp.]